MYFVEIDVIFFARLYCMISKWSVDTTRKNDKKYGKKIKETNKKKLGSVCCSFFGDKSLHADKGRAFWYCFTRVQMFVVESLDRTKCLILHQNEYFVVELSKPSSEGHEQNSRTNLRLFCYLLSELGQKRKRKNSQLSLKKQIKIRNCPWMYSPFPWVCISLFWPLACSRGFHVFSCVF